MDHRNVATLLLEVGNDSNVEDDNISLALHRLLQLYIYLWSC